jgi:hypothetical protein
MAEALGVCRLDPGGCRHSLTWHWPGAVSLRAAERPSLFVSAAGLVPCDVSERSICLFSPSVHSSDVLRRSSLDASLSASSSSPPKNCPLSRSRMGPLGLRVDFGRRFAGFRWPRGAASGPTSRRAPPLCGGRGSVPRGSVAQSGEVSDGGADAFFLTLGPDSRARATCWPASVADSRWLGRDRSRPPWGRWLAQSFIHTCPTCPALLSRQCPTACVRRSSLAPWPAMTRVQPRQRKAQAASV